MWRGPEQNGISRETGLVDKWSPPNSENPKGENLLWSNPDYASRSTPVVMKGRLYLIAPVDQDTKRWGERLICADAATGKKIWEHRWNVYLSDVPGERVSWSSAVADPASDRIFAQGVCGYFVCCDALTGKVLWSHSMHEEFGLLSTYGGRTNFPIVFENLVIISSVMTGWGEYARPNHRFIAFDKNDGKIVWVSGTRPLPDDTTYSTPTLGVLGGQTQMVFGAGDGGLYSFQPRTGREVWKYNMSKRGMNVSPVIDGDKVYMCQSEENLDDNSMGSVVALTGTGKGVVDKTNIVWRTKEIMVGKSSPVIVDGRIYTIDDGAGLFVVDEKTGKLLGKQKLGTMFRGSPLFADGRFYLCDATGRWAIGKPTADGIKVIHKLKLSGEVHASPIVSNGRIYLPTTENFYCIGKEGHTVAGTPRPETAKETAASEGDAAELLQVVPAESLVRPGETVQFEARLYNARGQFLKTTPATFKVDANGVVDETGKYVATSEKIHGASILTASVGKLKALVRIRIVPDLPWTFDFSDGKVPVPWVGANYRHVVREINGEKVMVKVTTIPKGTRSQAWFGHTDLHDYTIQADVLGNKKDGKVPDIGITGQRYTLDLKGASQEVMIRSWEPTRRAAVTKKFAWKPGVWYVMKLRSENQGDTVVCKGKIWERGQPEPDAWTIEAVDETPNKNGSPGLYANATNAEIFYDNIKVYANP